jgi:general nucleoside transport system permease protein
MLMTISRREFLEGIAAGSRIAEHQMGLIVGETGDSAAAAPAMGVAVDLLRSLATAAGEFLAGVGGAFLSRDYPACWNQGLSSE